MSITESTKPTLTNFYALNTYNFSSVLMATLSNGDVAGKKTLKIEPAMGIVNGGARFRIATPDPLLAFFFGRGGQANSLDGESWVSGKTLVDHFQFPLDGRTFYKEDGVWVSHLNNSRVTSKMTLEGEAKMGGVPCLKFGHQFVSPYGGFQLDSFQTIWVRVSDNSVQRLEWEIRQSGSKAMIDIKKLKVTFWRNR